jgi:hypothetical protein
MIKRIETQRDPRDFQIPIVLILVGFLIWAFVGYRMMGTAGPAIVLAVIGVGAVIGTAIMIAAAFLTAKLLGMSFGELGPAILKLAAIYLFPAAVGSLFPFGVLLALVLWFALLLWMFEIEVFQAIVFVIVLFVVRLAVGWVLAQALA